MLVGCSQLGMPKAKQFWVNHSRVVLEPYNPSVSIKGDFLNVSVCYEKNFCFLQEIYLRIGTVFVKAVGKKEEKMYGN